MSKRECRNCVWYGQCGDSGVCEWYEADETVSNAEPEEYYEQDLRYRHELYIQQINEQDS